VAVLTLNRPDKMNAISLSMRSGTFPWPCRKSRRNDDLRALIITGRRDSVRCGCGRSSGPRRRASRRDSRKTILQLTGR